MDDESYEAARRIWKERKFPVLVKPLTGKLYLRFPTQDICWPLSFKAKGHAPKQELTKDRWLLPRNRFNDLINEILSRWGAMHVIQYFTELKKCAPACRQAQGLDCECACGGEYHGVDGPPGKWIDISEAMSVARGDHYLSCRLLKRRSDWSAARKFATLL